MTELMIEDTVKTVGGTSIDATAGSTKRTFDKQTAITGLIEALNPDHTVLMGPPWRMRVWTKSAPDAVKRRWPMWRPRQLWWNVLRSISAKRLTILTDMARLMIVTQYAGSETVNVYASDWLLRKQ